MKKGYVHIAVVLDQSGSMWKIKQDTIGGYNSFLNGQKGQEGKASFSLAKFSHGYDLLYNMVDVEEAPELTHATYVPSGSTALYDAIGKTINETGRKLRDLPVYERPEKVIFVIITDGEENASREFTSSQIQEMINHQRDVYKWEFMFIGANQDAIAEAKKIGIRGDLALAYSANAVGTESLYGSIGSNLKSFRMSVAKGEVKESLLNFNEADRKKQEEANKA